jgi:hypothetical protein
MGQLNLKNAVFRSEGREVKRGIDSFVAAVPDSLTAANRSPEDRVAHRNRMRAIELLGARVSPLVRSGIQRGVQVS